MTEVAVQYEQKVEKQDELLTRLDKSEPSRGKVTLLTIYDFFNCDLPHPFEPSPPQEGNASGI